MKKMSLKLFFLEKDSKKQWKQVIYKQVETKDDDEKADVDRRESVPQGRSRMIERPVCDFQTRRVRRAIEDEQRRGAS